MKKTSEKSISLYLFFGMLLFFTFIAQPVSAVPVPPDRAQNILDTMAVECQSLFDYAGQANSGNSSAYESTRQKFATMINNVALLLNGYSPQTVQNLWNVYQSFSPDGASATNTANGCQQIRGSLYQEMTQADGVLNPAQSITSYDDCAKAGYTVRNGTCFIGGTYVYDTRGNVIGLYYSDCYDSTGFYQGTCWDCYYGASIDGCNPKP